MKFYYPKGATPIDADELAALIPQYITTQHELNVVEGKNILKAEKWAIKKKEILSDIFVKKLHEHMFNETWKWAGEFRKSEKNIGVTWEKIPVAVKELCENVKYQLKYDVYSKDEIVVRFHHKLTYIHPFPNGNGRHARIMADLLIMSIGEKRFSWGPEQEIAKDGTRRKYYIEALQMADQGDVSQLLKFARSNSSLF